MFSISKKVTLWSKINCVVVRIRVYVCLFVSSSVCARERTRVRVCVRVFVHECVSIKYWVTTFLMKKNLIDIEKIFMTSISKKFIIHYGQKLIVWLCVYVCMCVRL